MSPLTSKYHHQEERGFTLTELAIVLGVVGTMLGAIWVAAAQVNQNHKAAKATTEVLQIYGSYKAFYGDRNVDGTSWSDITCLGINAGLIPSDMIAPGTTCTSSTPSPYPRSPWGTDVQVRADSGLNGIIISFWGLSQKACMGLASGLANAPDVLLSYVGNPTTGLAYPPAGTASRMTSAQISSYCNSSGGNEVTFDFYIH